MQEKTMEKAPPCGVAGSSKGSGSGAVCKVPHDEQQPKMLKEAYCQQWMRMVETSSVPLGWVSAFTAEV